MSDVLDGTAFEEGYPQAEIYGLEEPASAGHDAFPAAMDAAPTPEILVEGEDELRLRDFFALRLWGAAWIPLLFTAVTSTLTAVRVSDAISPLGRGTPYEDLFFQAPTIPLAARWLLPFGLPLTTPTGYGYGQTTILMSSMLIGVVALLIGLLLVAAVTRRTNDAIYAAGPYFIYSCLAIIVLQRGGKYFQTATDVFPALLGALLAPVLIGFVAKFIGAWMRNQGWLEADLNMYRGEEEEPALRPQLVTAPATDAAASTGPVEQGPRGLTEVIGSDTAPASARLRHVTLAKACPFCGNLKIQHENPHACSRCHRNIGLAIEHDELACPHCAEALVTGAEFCHHCTMWLKGYVEPLADELGVA